MPFPSVSAPSASKGREQPQFSIKVNDSMLSPKYGVLAVRVQHEADRIPTAHLVFRDGNPAESTFALSSEQLLKPGAKVEILAGYRNGAEEQSLFKGIVVKHALEGRATTGISRLVVTCKDPFVKTTLAPQRHYYQQQTDSQVVEDIVGRYPDLHVTAPATSVTHPELVQYDITDWDFILLRAGANGLLCLLDDGELTLTAPASTTAPVLALKYGDTLLDFDAELDARDQATTLKALAWDPATGEAAEAEAAEPAADQFGKVTTQDLAGVLGVAQTLHHDGTLPPNELQTWADATLLRQRLAKVRGRVQCYGTAVLKPGVMIQLDGLGEMFTGPAFVSGVSHRLENGTWLTDAQLGLDPRDLSHRLTATGGAALSPGPAAGLLAGVQGLQIGVVTALAGDDTGEERIAVRLPLVDAAADGTRARVLSLDAGKERGFYSRPEVGDEVVVGFLHNDPRQAVVLGGLHGSRFPVPPPFVTADANNLKGYVSRSKLQVVFDDEKKTLTLKTPGGNLLSLDDEAKGITIQDQHGNKIVLSEAGISLESSKALTVKATTDAKLEAQNVELKAQAQLKATGAAGAELSSSATAVLKGATVMIN